VRRVEEFLASQHQIGEKTKRLYRIAVGLFERHAQAEFEDCYLDSGMIDKGLNGMAQELEPSTWNGYTAKLKRYAKWLSDPDDLDYPKAWRKVKLKHVDWEAKLKGKWLSENEVALLIENADSTRDKALVGVCWEGGFRAGELLGLRIGDCKRASYGFDLMVSGKTGTGLVPIVLTAPLLDQWLSCHPRRDDKNAFVFIRRKGSGFEPILVASADKMLHRIVARAGIQKRVTLHWLRHTQATYVADHDVNEEKMRKMFRWAKGSAMPSRYTHLTGEDAKRTKLALVGVEKVEERTEQSKLTPRSCFGCGERNSFDAGFCKRCGLPLNKDEAEKLVRRRRFSDLMDEWIEKDPSRYEKLLEFFESTH
jgi:integrase